ncbi:MAG: MxaK protein [Pseudomonadota bacterium]|nr:MxaK protein [Pseudomonadota bacterium]
MAMRRYRMRRGSLLILLLGLCLGVLIESIALTRAGAHNRTIERLLAGEDIPITGDAPPEVMFARAHWLMQKNRGDEAIDLFNRLEGKGDPEFRARLRYNLGNLYLTRAIALTEQSEYERAFTLTALAKDLYREALRLDSWDWDAKYNLEVAMRLVPDLPQAETDEPDQQRRQQGLWSSIPGFPRGLP